jgi:hypothetical protein
MATAQQTTPPGTVVGTAREIIEYLQARADDARFLLVEEPAVEETVPPLTGEEEEALLDEAGNLARGRLDPTFTYDRSDIYFDR